ncbi:cell division protein FtsW [Candidatus Gracilibacteria bacterium]|nr:cell division protein FtsW [Candidatus Gracilibacteria bacterium]
MTKTNNNQIDYILLLGIVALIVSGLILITSIGVAESIQITKPDGVLFPECGENGVDCFYLVKKRLFHLGLGLIAFFACFKIPYTLWRKLAVPIFGLSFVGLIVVLIIGSSYNTFAKSWLVIGNNSLQPTEFAKLALIFYLALWLSRKGEEIKDFHKGFISFGILVAISTLPVLLQPDLGSTMIFILIAVTLFYLAGGQKKHILTAGIGGLIALTLLVSVTEHQKHRVLSYINPTEENCIVKDVYQGETVTRDYCWQTKQANIAIGTGGILGRGLTKGVQKSYWLPQAADDFIFAASAEELGFVRTMVLVGLFGLIAYRGFLIAVGAPDRFAKYTAAGITIWIVGQALINIGVNTALIPITGITLPFISYGGSSLLATLAACGILLNISKSVDDYVKPSANRRRDRRSPNAQLGSYRRA